MASSERLFIGGPASTGITDLYTVPPGTGVLLTSLLLTKRGSGTATVSWYVRSGGNDVLLWRGDLTGAGQQRLERPWCILLPADKLAVDQSAATSLWVCATGLAFDL